MTDLTFRFAERKDIPLILRFIKELADYVTSDMFHYGIRDGLKYLKLI